MKSRNEVDRHSANTLHISFSPMIVTSDSRGRRSSRVTAPRSPPESCSRVRSILTSENSAVSDAANRLAINSSTPAAKGSTHILALVLPGAVAQLIPAARTRGADQTPARFAQPQPPFTTDDAPHPANGDPEPPAALSRRMTGGHAKQQIVSVGAALRPAQPPIRPPPDARG